MRQDKKGDSFEINLSEFPDLLRQADFASQDTVRSHGHNDSTLLIPPAPNSPLNEFDQSVPGPASAPLSGLTV